MKFINNRVLFIALILVLFAGAYSCQKDQGGAPDRLRESTSTRPTDDRGINELLASLDILRFKEAENAPDFELLSLEGATNNLSQYKGNVVLLSFWTTW